MLDVRGEPFERDQAFVKGLEEEGRGAADALLGPVDALPPPQVAKPSSIDLAKGVALQECLVLRRRQVDTFSASLNHCRVP